MYLLRRILHRLISSFRRNSAENYRHLIVLCSDTLYIYTHEQFQPYIIHPAGGRS